jgi:hypothetical protein
MGKRIDKANPQRNRVRYTKEFNLEAVRLLERGEKPHSPASASNWNVEGPDLA